MSTVGSKLKLFICFRSDAFDVCLCIAVLHHLSTAERRLAGLRELVRVTRPGGLVLVYVWALEQEIEKVKKKNLKEVDFTGTNEDDSVTDGNIEDESLKNIKETKETFPSKSENPSDHSKPRLRVNASRESFEQQDLFVPWKYSGPGKQQEKQRKVNGQKGDVTEGLVFHRYYHVFQDGELVELCSQLSDVTVEKQYYDKGNWCVILRKKPVMAGNWTYN